MKQINQPSIVNSMEIPFSPQRDLSRAVTRYLHEYPEYIVIMNGKAYVSLLSLLNFIGLVVAQKQLCADSSLTIAENFVARKFRSISVLSKLWKDIKLQLFLLRDMNIFEIWIDCAEEDLDGFHFQKLHESMEFPSDSTNAEKLERMIKFLKFRNLYCTYITIENLKV